MKGLGWVLHHCSQAQACTVQHTCCFGQAACSWHAKPARLSSWELPASHLRHTPKHMSRWKAVIRRCSYRACALGQSRRADLSPESLINLLPARTDPQSPRSHYLPAPDLPPFSLWLERSQGTFWLRGSRLPEPLTGGPEPQSAEI